MTNSISKVIFCLVTLVLYISLASANVSAELEHQILTNLRDGPKNIEYESVHDTPVEGIFRILLADGKSIYANADGTFVFSGELYSVKPEKFVSWLEMLQAGDRAKLLSVVDKSKLITYLANESPKATIHIFIDTDCPYCSKLHKEIPALNALGISIRYLAYPRAGLYSPSFTKLTTVWCSQQPKKALIEVQMNQIDQLEECDDHPVEEHYYTGNKMGVTGTPTIIFESGEMISGYRSATEIAGIALRQN